ncbi:MAG: hypothetical protein JOZ04_07160 [Acidimicrobiia bacterium]|nr:hypothetical protein [Acidimicrobiia bacterium]
MEPEAEALYGLPLDEFTKARNGLARARSKAGDKDASAAVKALPKPSVVAWALNQLARRRPEAIAALLEAGSRVRRAQTAALDGGDPVELRDAGRAENAEVQALAAEARSILADAGRGGSPAQEERLAATLRAAAVNPDAGDRLQRGVLTEELSPAGFGFGIGEDTERDALQPESEERQDGRGQRRHRQASAAPARQPGQVGHKTAAASETSKDGRKDAGKDAEKDAEEAANRQAQRAAAREADRAAREHRREREQELRAARDTAARLEREADRAEQRAHEARIAAEAAAARVETLAGALHRSPAPSTETMAVEGATDP